MSSRHLDVVLSQLVAMGWEPLGGVAIARKLYDTAVGPKEAQAYLSESRVGDPNVSLSGVYFSEGRNILEPHGVLLPVDADEERLGVLARQFADNVDRVVSDSYAARLLKQ